MILQALLYTSRAPNKLQMGMHDEYNIGLRGQKELPYDHKNEPYFDPEKYPTKTGKKTAETA